MLLAYAVSLLEFSFIFFILFSYQAILRLMQISVKSSAALHLELFHSTIVIIMGIFSLQFKVVILSSIFLLKSQFWIEYKASP